MIKIKCIVGATGTGKTALALKLAKEHNGAIINCDSRQIYKDFPIITAQPSIEEQGICPHHLYGFLDSTERFTAGKFIKLAKDKIYEVVEAGYQAIFVGGTGMYLKALFEGIVDIPQIPQEIRENLINECSHHGSAYLHDKLKQIDAKYAAKIHFNDKQRIMRALEVYYGTGRTFSSWHDETEKNTEFEVEYHGLDMPLNDLEPRLAKRIDIMLEMGAIEEAKIAKEICNDRFAPGWSGIGCIELFAYLEGEMDLEESKKLWLKQTRAYAKRQRTWFLAQKQIIWN